MRSFGAVGLVHRTGEGWGPGVGSGAGVGTGEGVGKGVELGAGARVGGGVEDGTNVAGGKGVGSWLDVDVLRGLGVAGGAEVDVGVGGTWVGICVAMGAGIGVGGRVTVGVAVGSGPAQAVSSSAIAEATMRSQTREGRMR